MKKPYQTAPVLAPFIQKALKRQTQLDIDIDTEQVDADNGVDAIATFPSLPETQFAVLSKRWLPQADISEVIKQLKSMPQPALLIADFVNPSMAKELQKHNFNYLDIAGNGRVFAGLFHLLIKGNKESKALPSQKEKPSRAFGTTGLKVTYLFLCTPSSVNFSYRDIAKTAGVALGSVGWVVNDLKAEGFIVETESKNNKGELVTTKQLTQYQTVLDRWVDAYDVKLKPKMLLGYCNAPTSDWWKETNLQSFQGLWGGSVAAHYYLGAQANQHVNLYIPEGTVRQLIRSKNLTPAENGNIAFYKPLWQPQNPQQLAHPVLAYADLKLAGETALASQLFQQRLSMY